MWRFSICNLKFRFVGEIWSVAENLVSKVHLTHLKDLHGFEGLDNVSVYYDRDVAHSSMDYKIYVNLGHALLNKVVLSWSNIMFPWFTDHFPIHLESKAFSPGHVVSIATFPDGLKVSLVFSGHKSGEAVELAVKINCYGHHRGWLYSMLVVTIARIVAWKHLREHLKEWEKKKKCEDEEFRRWFEHYGEIDHPAIEELVGKHVLAMAIGSG